jgi:phospholipid/cholesterol/gamma-HCH transport system substrate-binding protein
MNDSAQRHSVIVGIFVVLGLAILISGILLIGNLNKAFQEKIKVHAIFEDVNGLQKGNYIWFSGMRIGRVKGLHLRGPSKVEVVMDIDSKTTQYIQKDSKVKLGSDGFIGNRILVIIGGTAVAGTIQDGDTLKVEKTLDTDDMIKTLQQNNENLKSITGDFKIITKRMADGEGTLGKLLSDNTVYSNISAATLSLQKASEKAQQMIGSLNELTAGMKKKGTLAHELTTDTAVFRSLSESVKNIQRMSDSASVFINHLKKAENDPRTPVGMLMNDAETGAHMKETIKNLEVSSQKLSVDLEALQHSFLLRKYFKNKAKQK